MVPGLGNIARIKALFLSSSGAPADPSTVKVKIRTPAGAESELTYLTDAAVLRDSVGAYHVDVTLAQVGAYRFRWVGAGALVAAQETSLSVGPSGFAVP